jgi:tripartite-type tricarboxylate transporter receptor subunit TctC
MNPFRRGMLGCAAFAIALSAAGMARADSYPSKPITLIVPFTSGGSADNLARVVATALGGSLKQPVVIDNRTGAGGLVGTSLVAKAPADGYTLLLAPVSLYAINPSLYGKKAQEALDALVPVTHLAEAPLVFAVPGDSPINDFPGLLAAARSSKTPLSYGTPGIGTDHHLLGELIAKTAGVKLNHVPYRGASAALGDLAGKQIDLLITLVTTAQPMVSAGKVKLIAVATTQPYAAQPQLSRSAETLKGTDMLVGYGVLAPAGTPAPLIAKLNEAINAALKNKAVSDKLTEQGLTPTGGTIQSFSQRMGAERRLRESIIRDAGIKLAEQS